MSSPEAIFLEKMVDRKKYRGQWIAILGDRVIASGKDIRDVYVEATKSAGGASPLFVQIMGDNDTEFLNLGAD